MQTFLVILGVGVLIYLLLQSGSYTNNDVNNVDNLDFDDNDYSSSSSSWSDFSSSDSGSD